MFGVYALMPMRGGKWIRVHPEDRGEMELREAVAERDAIIDDLKARIAELEAALANKQVPAEAEEMGGEKWKKWQQSKRPTMKKRWELRSGLTRTRKIQRRHVVSGTGCNGRRIPGNNAGLQQKITVLDNDGNRKPISNGAFYRLIEQAKGRGLISVEQEIKHKKDENGNQIGKGKKGDKLITLLPNWIDKLGDE